MSQSRFRSEVTDKVNLTTKFQIDYRIASQSAWYPYRTIYPLAGKPQYMTNRYCTDELHPGPPYLTGGPFHLEELRLSYSPLANDGTRYVTIGSGPGATIYRLKGGFTCALSIGDIAIGASASSSKTSTNGSVASYGAAAWNKFKPLKPEVGLAQTIAEARDLPRMLMQGSRVFHEAWKSIGGKRHIKDTSKSVADHFLSYQFGWIPFISDVRGFYNLSKNLDTKIGNLKRNNKKWIRRTGSVKVDYVPGTVTNYNFTSHYPNDAWPLCQSTTGNATTVNRYTTKNVHFVGVYRYYVPELDSPNWHSWAIRRLYGLQITPTLLWELTPWSWLVDWFSNAGDVISNLEDNLLYDLVSKYAYVCGTTSICSDVHSTLNTVQGPLSHTWHFAVNYKDRAGADPYSFSWDGGSLSSRQSAILAALGVTRLR